MIVDNTELSDVDIFDITDPRNPVFIADLDLFELAFDAGRRHRRRRRGQRRARSFHHDMVVKEIDGVPIDARLLLGRRLHQAQRRPTRRTRSIIGDSDFGDEDPLMNDPGHRRRLVARPRATATRPSSATTTSSCSPRTRTSTSTASLGAGRPGRGRRLHASPAVGAPDEGPQRHSGRPAGRATPGSSATAALRRTSRPRPRASRSPSSSAATCNFQVKTENAERARLRRRDHLQQRDAAPRAVRRPAEHGRSRATPGTALHDLRRRASVGFAHHRRLRPRDVHLRRRGAATPTPAAPRERQPGRSRRRLFDGWGYMHLYDNDGDDLDGGRPLRDRGGRRRALRDRLRRPDGARVRHRPDGEPGLQRRTTPAACACCRSATTASTRSASSSTRAATTSGASSSSRPRTASA